MRYEMRWLGISVFVLLLCPAVSVAETLSAVFFVTPEIGWAVGSTGTIMHTSDTGETWETQDSGSTFDLFDVNFINDEKGWIAGSNGAILETFDGGIKWSNIIDSRGKPLERFERDPTGLLNNIIGLGTWSVYFATPETGWAVGEVGKMLKSENGGKTWIGKASEMVFSNLISVAGVGDMNAIMVGQNMIVSTMDGGNSWMPQFVGPVLHDIVMVDTQNAWAVGDGGAIMHTTDGGMSWTDQVSGFNGSLYDAHFDNAQEGWAVGSKGAILHTTDGGITWLTESSGTTYDLHGVHRPKGGNLWAVGSWGAILMN